MNRSSRESPKRGRKPSMAVQALQGRPVKDESLEFFSWLKKCPTVPPNEAKPSKPGGVQGKMKSKVNGKVETEDLLSTDIGKNEYDWLLIPPAAPSVSSHPIRQNPSSPAKDNPKVRSVSATRPSRFSHETSNSNSNPKLARSSSVTRSSISNTTTRSSISNSMTRSSSIFNSTNRSSISNSTTRHSSSNTSTPSTNKSSHNSTRQSPASVASKSSSPLTRPASSRLLSPLKTQNLITTPNPLTDKHKPPSSSPSTPKTAATSTPRQPTPTRHATSSMISSVPPVSRSSSLTWLPDTKNMRIPKPPERSVSAVRQRLIGATTSMSLNQRPATSPVSSPRRNMTRSQFGESLAKSRLSGLSENRKMIRPPEKMAKKFVKPVPPIDKAALSRTGSRKSLDTNAKITDKSIMTNRRAALYPRSNSNRLSTSKNRSEPTSRSSVKIVPTDDTSHGTSSDRAASNDSSVRPLSDTFESARYDAILLKEDAKNLNWLIGGDDTVLQSPLFHRFDPLPEPFDI